MLKVRWVSLATLHMLARSPCWYMFASSSCRQAGRRRHTPKGSVLQGGHSAACRAVPLQSGQLSAQCRRRAPLECWGGGAAPPPSRTAQVCALPLSQRHLVSRPSAAAAAAAAAHQASGGQGDQAKGEGMAHQQVVACSKNEERVRGRPPPRCCRGGRLRLRHHHQDATRPAPRFTYFSVIGPLLR